MVSAEKEKLLGSVDVFGCSFKILKHPVHVPSHLMQGLKERPLSKLIKVLPPYHKACIHELIEVIDSCASGFSDRIRDIIRTQAPTHLSIIYEHLQDGRSCPVPVPTTCWAGAL